MPTRHASTPARSASRRRFTREDDEADQSATPVATEIQNLLLDARLSRGLNVLVDSTNVFPHVRAGLLARARYWQRPAVAVLFDVPLSTVEARNAGLITGTARNRLRTATNEATPAPAKGSHSVQWRRNRPTEPPQPS
jgi:predicted kinase